MKEETTYHIPVLLMPSVDGMNIRPDGTYVDVTFGGGGHSMAAGVRIRGPIEEVRLTILKAMREEVERVIRQKIS